VISWPHTKGSVIDLGRHGNMEVLYSPKGDEITMCGYRAQTSAECTTVITAGLTVLRGLGSSRDSNGSGWFWFWYWFGLDYWFESVGQFFCFVLCGTSTLVLYGQQPLSSMGQELLSSMGNNPCPLWDINNCPLWATTLVSVGQQPLFSMGNNPCPPWDGNPYPLWATTLVLCGTTSLVLCGTHHLLWLPFCLIGWFGLWLGFKLSFGDSLGQGCEATIWVVWFVWQPSIPSPLMN
jgi:hypothetical protein